MIIIETNNQQFRNVCKCEYIRKHTVLQQTIKLWPKSFVFLWVVINLTLPLNVCLCGKPLNQEKAFFLVCVLPSITTSVMVLNDAAFCLSSQLIGLCCSKVTECAAAKLPCCSFLSSFIFTNVSSLYSHSFSQLQLFELMNYRSNCR